MSDTLSCALCATFNCDLLLNSRAQLFEGQSELTQG